jgi:hypothetical protein
MSDLGDFRSSVARHLTPVATTQGLRGPTWIPRGENEALCLFSGSPFDLLIYDAGGHGVNMTVTIAPDSGGVWNPSDELGLDRLCRLLGLPNWDGSRRYGSSVERDAHIVELSQLLPSLLEAARAHGEELWSALQRQQAVRAEAR